MLYFVGRKAVCLGTWLLTVTTYVKINDAQMFYFTCTPNHGKIFPLSYILKFLVKKSLLVVEKFCTLSLDLTITKACTVCRTLKILNCGNKLPCGFIIQIGYQRVYCFYVSAAFVAEASFSDFPSVSACLRPVNTILDLIGLNLAKLWLM